METNFRVILVFPRIIIIVVVKKFKYKIYIKNIEKKLASRIMQNWKYFFLPQDCYPLLNLRTSGKS